MVFPILFFNQLYLSSRQILVAQNQAQDQSDQSDRFRYRLDAAQTTSRPFLNQLHLSSRQMLAAQIRARDPSSLFIRPR